MAKLFSHISTSQTVTVISSLKMSSVFIAAHVEIRILDAKHSLHEFVKVCAYQV
jgi:hypothetical protein